MLDLIEPEDPTIYYRDMQTLRQTEAGTELHIRRFTRAMWIAVLILALFNSTQLMTVVNGFSVGPVQDTVVAMATTWNEQMEKNKLDVPVALIRNGVSQLRGLDWDALVGDDGPERGAAILRGTVKVDGRAG